MLPSRAVQSVQITSIPILQYATPFAPPVISVVKLNQLVNKDIFIGKINISQLKGIIKYSDRKPNPNDPFREGYEDTKKDFEHYQRVKSSDRAYQIKLFFLKHIWNKYHFKNQLQRGFE